MGNAIDLTGQRFGKLVAVKLVRRPNKKRRYWLCECDCDDTAIVSADKLRAGRTKSCGCLKSMDLTGKRFGRLVVLTRSGLLESKVKWLCLCDCGNKTVVATSDLNRSATKSCGCLVKPDLIGNRFGFLVVVGESKRKGSKLKWLCRCDCGNFSSVHSFALNNGNTQSCGCKKKTLGVSALLYKHEYTCWRQMIARCRDDKDTNYCARGISVCERWRSFKLFIADMGERPSVNYSIERVDNDGGYEPNNCIWATAKTQGRNKRNNFIIEYKGERKCLAEWCELLGLRYSLTHGRLRMCGWSVERAFTK